MKATKWQTLSNFVHYLGKTGKVIVTNEDRGLHVQRVETKG